jgi:tetratricopeptide (TPR) repeat protein
MTPALRTTLQLGALILCVVLAAVLYVRLVGVNPTPRGEGRAAGQTFSGRGADLLTGTDPEAASELGADLEAGLEAARQGDYEEARALLETTAPSDPGYLVALGALGTVYAALDRHDDAVAALSRLTTLQPGDTNALMRLAWSEFAAGDSQRAELSALQVLELDPRNVDARYDLGLFRIGQDHLDQAVRTYYRAIREYPDQQRFGTARARLELLHEERPDLASVHYALAFFANTIGDFVTEARELEHYLELAPDGSAAANARKRLAEVPR